MTNDSGARRFITRPTGKFGREDRAAIKHLWSLLYRAVRRDALRVDRALRSIAAVARRLGALSVELTDLRARVDRLERAYWRDREQGEDDVQTSTS